MDTKSLNDLENIVDNATDAIEYQLVAASLIAMIDTHYYANSFELYKVLKNLINDFNSKMTIEVARRKCKAAITAVSMALHYN